MTQNLQKKTRMLKGKNIRKKLIPVFSADDPRAEDLSGEDPGAEDLSAEDPGADAPFTEDSERNEEPKRDRLKRLNAFC